MAEPSIRTYLLRYSALLYLALLLFVPVGMVVYRTFQHGISPFWNSIDTSEVGHAAYLSILIAAIAVPINLVFGIGTAWLLARRRMPLPWLVNGLVNLPFAMSPVVIGLAVFIIYGTNGWFGQSLSDLGISVLFTVKAMVLATIFVSLPFVVREVVPVLEELGTEQEQAAEVLGANGRQTFWRVTLPAIRWAVVYGVVLSSARALGEFGAVSIVSGNILGQTQTLPLVVDDRFTRFDETGAYATSFLLALISLVILVGMTLMTNRRRSRAEFTETTEVAG